MTQTPADGALIVGVVLFSLGLHLILGATVESWLWRRKRIRRSARRSAH